jgi:hypothetical protein
MRTGRWLAAITLCFGARILFYATAYPLWEGFDEWAHFGVVRAIAFDGRLLVPRDARVPLDVFTSIQLAPTPPGLSYLPPEAVSHENFWTLPAEERRRREEAFRAIPREFAGRPSTIGAYEALQPPVYYWLMAPALRAARGASLATQVFLLRWLSILIAALIVPLVFLVAREAFADDHLALGCAGVVALMPELAIDVARVGNECVAVVLYTAATLFALRRKDGWAFGLVLGAGLLTKAYFLAALAGVALVVWAPRAFGVAILVSGWWYARNLWTTGTLSGLSEAVALRAAPPFQVLAGAVQLPWRKAVDSILLSHLYFGGWSSLTARSWMYHLLYLVIAIAAAGALLLHKKREIRSLSILYAAFWIAQLYNVVLIYATKGIPTSMGWYLFAVIGAQSALALSGLRRVLGRAAVWISAGLFAALDLYGMHGLSLPYYAGLLQRKATGGLAGLNWDGLDIREMFSRLAAFKPGFVTPGVLMGLWGIYLLSTVLLVAIAARLSRGVKRA